MGYDSIVDGYEFFLGICHLHPQLSNLNLPQQLNTIKYFWMIINFQMTNLEKFIAWKLYIPV